MKLYYLATVYSLYPDGLEEAYQLSCHNAACLVKAGIAVFSPIAHSHGIAQHGNLDAYDYDIWMPLDHILMRACDGLIVLRSPGWERSHGIGIEVGAFRAAGKPVIYMDPDMVPKELLTP